LILRVLAVLIVLLATAAFATLAEAAEEKRVGYGPRLRKDVLARVREAKADSVVPPTKPGLEKVVEYVETADIVDLLRYGYYGFYPKFGGLSENAETVLGVLYRNDFTEHMCFDWSAALSRNLYQQYDASLNIFRRGRLPANLRLYNRYRNFTEEAHYGLGPGSREEAESAFRLEDYRATLGLELGPMAGFTVSGKTGYLHTRTGARFDESDQSSEKVLAPGDLLGFGEELEFWLNQAEVSLDFRDSRGNPRSGVLLAGVHTLYADQDGDSFDFERSEAQFQAYLPFLHKHRVVAMRAYVANVVSRNEGQVPFNFLPYVGGANSLRGFEEYRFRDAKIVLINAEYRFEGFIGMDVALFGDFGQVAPHWEDIRTSQFETSYGGGLRFNTFRSVFMRFDVGHGREGTRFYLKLGNVGWRQFRET
jgi:outer membrane protein assembly factor BamA